MVEDGGGGVLGCQLSIEGVEGAGWVDGGEDDLVGEVGDVGVAAGGGLSAQSGGDAQEDDEQLAVVEQMAVLAWDLLVPACHLYLDDG